MVVEASLAKGVTVRTGDDLFSITGTVLTQQRFDVRMLDGDLSSAGFQVRMVRPVLRGHLFRKWIRYFVQPELAGPTPQLLDLQFDVQPTEAFGVRFGQFLTPFSRTFTTPVPLLLFPDFSIANDVFRASRDTGLLFYGTPFGGRFEYAVGVFNGNGINKAANDNTAFMPMARIAWNPLGGVKYDETPALAGSSPTRLGFGLNGYWNKVSRTQQVVDPGSLKTIEQVLPDQRNTTVGADVVLHTGFWTVQAEGYHRRLQESGKGDQSALGGYVHASRLFPDTKLELAARANLVNQSLAKDDLVRSGELLGTWYVSGNNLKLQARYALIDADTTFQKLGAGIHNQLTLQIQGLL